MPRVFLAPYESPLLGSREDGGCAKPFSSLHAAMLRREWRYDYGDDPSFFSRLQHHASLTWGVCRPDVRTQSQEGDVVVFFSFTKTAQGTDYCLCAIATIEKKIKHSDIFENREHASYRKYLNLLVRPSSKDKSLWIHKEPGAPRKNWHKDWLGRVTAYRKYTSEELEQAAKAHQVRVGSHIGGRPFVFGQNYILFSEDPRLTAFIPSPPKVAHAMPYEAEKWCVDRLSRAIRRKTVGIAQSHGVLRSLRIKNKSQHAHSPVARWKDTTSAIDKWRSDIIHFLRAEGLSSKRQ